MGLGPLPSGFKHTCLYLGLKLPLQLVFGQFDRFRQQPGSKALSFVVFNIYEMVWLCYRISPMTHIRLQIYCAI